MHICTHACRWAAQQLSLEASGRVSGLEKRVVDLEVSLKEARAAEAAANAAEKEARAIAAAAEKEARAAAAAASRNQRVTLSLDEPLVPGLSSFGLSSSAAAPPTPPTPNENGDALGRHARQPRLPSRGGGGHQPAADGRGKPPPPAHPRPASLPDYRSADYPARAAYGGGGGGGGRSSMPAAGSAALGFRTGGYPKRAPSSAVGVLAQTLQQSGAPGGLLPRLGRLLGGGTRGKQREVEAARERARMAGAADNLSGLLKPEGGGESDESGDDDGADDEGIDGGGARPIRRHQHTSSGGGGGGAGRGSDPFGLDRLRRLLSGETRGGSPASSGITRERDSLSEPPTPRDERRSLNF